MASANVVVTPEAVPLALEPAGLPSRVLARLIDTVAQYAALIGALIAGNAVGHFGGGTALALVILTLFLVLLGYPIAFETLWRGRTPGKAALGLRVVTVEGGPVRFRHAAIRAVFALVEVMLPPLFGAIAIISVLLTRRNQRLGDLAAGTIVLRERTGLRAPVSVVFAVPAGLEHYADTLDTAAMTSEDYAAVRAFLLRASSLPWAIRADLALRLARAIGPRVRPEPLPGLHPEAYLACLAAAFQRRASPVAAAPVAQVAPVVPIAPGPSAPPAPLAEGEFAPPA